MNTFEDRINEFVNERQNKLEGSINAMFNYKLENMKEAEELCLSFPVLPWQVNPMGHMHGGLICTDFDITMGCLSYARNGGYPNPTIDLHVRFLRGIDVGETLYVKAHILSAGSRMIQVEAFAYVGDQKPWVAHATASYIVNNGNISHNSVGKQ